MAEKTQTKAGATELSEKDLEAAQGGFTAPGDVAGIKQGKKADGFKAGADLQKK